MRPILATLWAAMIVGGCAAPTRPIPRWADAERDVTVADAEADRAAERDASAALQSLALRRRDQRAPLEVLALSSGGQSGAFGAGFLHGLSGSGARPEFDLVTGASTGALIAVFAFIGDDHTLERLYTEHDSEDMYSPYPWVSVLTSSAYASSTPMRAVIEREISEATVENIARESAKNRVLLVATANLDLNRLRIWNLSALAVDPALTPRERTSAIREIIIAAISVPGLVPPVFLDGCMHADAGLVRQVFLPGFAPEETIARALTRAGQGPRVLVLVNRRLGSPPKVVRNRIIPIAARSVQMMIDAALARDVDEVRRFTESAGGRCDIVSLPHDAARAEPEGFLDRAYMKAVYDVGLKMGAAAPPARP